MARSGWAGWPSFQLLNYFHGSFAETEQGASRERELLADRKAAELTSPRTMARALVRFQVAVAAFQRVLAGKIQNPAANVLDLPLAEIVRTKLAPDAEFWAHLFEQKLPHPLDSHPSMLIRLEALGEPLTMAAAQAVALTKTPSAYDAWLTGRDALFTTLNQQAAQAFQQVQARSQVVAADYQTETGKQLLDEHFPVRTWTGRPAVVWGSTVAFSLLIVFCVALMIAINDPVAWIFFGLLVAVLALGILLVCRREWRAVLTLDVAGLQHTAWNRPLRFADVRNISARRTNGHLNLIIQLKTKQAPYWKFNLLPFPTISLTLSPGQFKGKPADLAQTIFRYFNRQAAPK